MKRSFTHTDFETTQKCPIRRLCVAMIHRAVADIAAGPTTSRKRANGGAYYVPVGERGQALSNYDSAVQWVESTDDRPSTFEWACEALDWDAELIRQEIVSRTWQVGEIYGTRVVGARVIPQEVAQ